MKKTYENNLKGFEKWAKDHPFNTKWEEEKEFHQDGAFYIELGLNDFSDGSLSIYPSIRAYDPEKKTFKLVDNYEKILLEKYRDLLDEYKAKHGADYLSIQ